MCLRALLFIFTSLLLVLSLSLVAAGLWLTIDQASMVQAVGELLNATNAQDGLTELPRLTSILDEATTLNFLNVVLIAVGGVCFFVALSGFCGARKDSPRLLITFAFFTLVFLALQIALVIHNNNNNNGDIVADVWENFNNASETEARVVNNNTEQESSSPFLMPMLSVFIQSGVCSLIPGVLLLASLSLACTAGRRKERGYIDTTQDEI